MIFLTELEKQRLQANWPVADSMACKAIARFYDQDGPWECYVFAQDPQDQDSIACIIGGVTVEISDWSLAALEGLYNSLGEKVIKDESFRPRLASIVYKNLMRKYGR